jgi:hypothetical protein
MGTMRQEEIWDVEVAQSYDTVGTGMFAPEVLKPTVDRLAELAGNGRALEFAIGTVAWPSHCPSSVFPVTGIELSPMIDQLRTKADEAIIPVVCGDMATTTVPGEFSGVPGIQHHFEPADPVRAGCLLPQRCPPPGARWPICNRTVGARPA